MLAAATGVWEFVRVLLDEGPGGLWRMLQERLSNLWGLVLDSVIGWVSTRVMIAATQWLLSLLDPTAIMAVITSCIAIYRAIAAFVQYLNEMLEIVARVLDGIVGIGSGAIEQAAGFLENAMARTLPVAIGFLAYQVGLGGLSTRIREFVEGVRERVDAALDWIIDRAIQLGQGFLALLDRGVAAVQRGVAAIREWWRARKAFRAQDGTEHSVYIEGQGATARLMVQSDPETYVRFIESRPAQRGQDRGADHRPPARRRHRRRRPRPGRHRSRPRRGPQTPTNHATIIQDLLDDLATVTARLMPADATGPSTPPIYGGQVQGYGSVVTVRTPYQAGAARGQLPVGSLPDDSWESCSTAQRRQPDLLRSRPPAERQHRRPRQHLVEPDPVDPEGQQQLGRIASARLRAAGEAGRARGPPDRLAPRRTACGELRLHRHLWPTLARGRGTTVRRHRRREQPPDRLHHPRGDQGSAGARLLGPRTGPARRPWPRGRPYRVENSIDTSDSSYEIFEGATPTVTIYVNDMPEQELTTRLTALRGIGAGTVASIVAGRPFTRHADLDSAIGTRYANILRNEFNVRLSQRGGTEA